MPATSACSRRAPPTRCAACRSATASSRGWRAGSASGRCASTTSRPSGCTAQTTFGWGSLLGLSIEGLTSFSVAPLRLASLLGAAARVDARWCSAPSMLFEVLVYGVAVPGYPSVVVGLMVLGGVQLVMIGVLGEYIGKILSEQKARPIYFVAEHSVKAAETGAGRRAPRPNSSGERVNETTPAHLAVRRRLRHRARRQRGDPRSRGARPAQRDLRDGGGAELLARRGASRSTRSMRPSQRVAIGLHLTLTGAAQAADAGLRAARRRRVPAAHHDVAARLQQRLDMAALDARNSARSSRRSRRPSAARRISSTAISTCICFRRCARPRSRPSSWIAPHAWVRQCGAQPAAARGA